MGLSNYCRPSFAAAGISGCGRRKKFPVIFCILIRSDRLRVLFCSGRAGEFFFSPCSGVLVWKFGLSFCPCCTKQARVSILHGVLLVRGCPLSVTYKCRLEKKALQISELEMGT